MLYCQICGERVDTVHRVYVEKGIRWLCPTCMAKLRKIWKERKKCANGAGTASAVTEI